MTQLPTVQHNPHADEYTKAYRAGQQAMLDEMTGLLNAATAERDTLAAQLDGAMQEASSLAMSIWKSEFSKEAPEFELCDSARGVVTQIDNMFAGIRNQRDELAAQVKELKSELRQEKLIHIGFTNESQVQYVTEDKEEGAFYPNSDHGCYIPVYMLNVHAHRVGPDSKIYCTQLEQGKKIAEIRAEAAIKGWWACWEWIDSDDRDKPTLIPAANQYHASILAGKE